MSRIDDLLAQYCPNGVEYRAVGDYISYEQPQKYIVTKEEISEQGIFPVLTPGKTFKLGYTSNNKNIFLASVENPVILFDDFTTAARWIDFHFAVKSSAVKILQPDKSHKINFKYFYYLLSHAHIVPQDHSRQWISKVSLMKVPVPPLQVQEEIVRILDSFTQLEAELEAELEARRKQYEYYRDSLLNFENLNNRLGGGRVKLMPLEDVCIKISSGGTPKRTVPSYFGGNIPWLRTQDIDFNEIFQTSATITEFGVSNSSANWVKENSVIIAMYGATAGKTAIAKIPLTTNQACCNLEINPAVANYRYVFHVVSNNYKQLKSLGRGSQSNINATIIKQYEIPVPPLPVQERIVQILDKFDALVNDLSSGLPAEIQARRQQYEYYRDQLLSFPAAK